jgi:hypothetical protein
MMLLALSAPVWALPSAAQEITAGGQVRPRFEFRDPLVAGRDAFASMRIRGQISAELENNVRAFVQVQDVRLWGEETSTLNDFNADNLDIHQGWLEVSVPGRTTLAARIGRQEIPLGGHRLMGNVNWTQQARSFDALRLSGEGPVGRTDVFAAWLSDATAATNTSDAYLLGTYMQLSGAGPGTLDLYGFFNRSWDRVVPDPDTEQATFGGRWWGEAGFVTFRAEGSYQLGDRGGLDVAAFMFAGRVGFGGPRGRVTLWYDYLSGDDDFTDTETKVFDTLFATNHKFYGFADLFLNIPVHTAGRGLQDAALKLSLSPHPSVTLGLDGHAFFVAQDQFMTTNHLGEEVDFAFTYRHSSNFRVTTGASQVIGADGLVEIGRLVGDMTWVYLMTDVTF